MRKSIRSLFDNYKGEIVEIKSGVSVSASNVLELTKKKITEEKSMMNTKTAKIKRKWSTVLIAVAAVAALSITAFAAHYYLTPKDVATHFERYELAEVFSEDGEVFDIPAQTTGDYTIKLLGMTSGKNLSGVSGATVDTEKSYIVGAISRTDGDAITDYTNLTITPLVEGYNPLDVNIFTIGGGAKQSFIYEGVEYFLLECESIEIFADSKVYVAAYEGIAPSAEIISTSENGEISFNENYTGAKALFELPLDKSKADPDAVNAFLNKD